MRILKEQQKASGNWGKFNVSQGSIRKKSFNSQRFGQVDIFSLHSQNLLYDVGWQYSTWPFRDPGFFHLAAPTSTRSSAIELRKRMQDGSCEVLWARPGSGMCPLYLHSVSWPRRRLRNLASQSMCLGWRSHRFGEHLANLPEWVI